MFQLKVIELHECSWIIPSCEGFIMQPFGATRCIVCEKSLLPFDGLWPLCLMVWGGDGENEIKWF